MKEICFEGFLEMTGAINVKIEKRSQPSRRLKIAF